MIQNSIINNNFILNSVKLNTILNIRITNEIQP